MESTKQLTATPSGDNLLGIVFVDRGGGEFRAKGGGVPSKKGQKGGEFRAKGGGVPSKC